MIALIDYGAGNVRSVQKALEAVGAKVRLVREPDALLTAEKLVLPGVGAFGDCMAGLRRAGLVTSTRGASGGYQLARPATEINAWQVIEALGGSFFPDEFCETHPGQLRNCVHTTSCAIRGLWSVVEGSVRGVLQKVTLADLKRDERAMVVWLEGPDAPGPSTSLSS